MAKRLGSFQITPRPIKVTLIELSNTKEVASLGMLRVLLQHIPEFDSSRFHISILEVFQTTGEILFFTCTKKGVTSGKRHNPSKYEPQPEAADAARADPA